MSAVSVRREWIFAGRLLPERSSIRLDGLRYSVEVEFADLGFSCRFHGINIIDSQIIARVSVISGDIDIYTLRNVLASHLRALADYADFMTGRHLDVEVTSAAEVGSPESWVIFGNTIPVLFKNSAKLEKESLTLALTDSSFQLALADFRKAMPDGTETGFYCYRAIEAIMQTFRQGTEKDADTWERMRSALRVERSMVDFIKARADDRRHGKSAPSVTDQDRQKMFKITSAILERYTALRANNLTELPLSFDLLSDSGGHTS